MLKAPPDSVRHQSRRELHRFIAHAAPRSTPYRLGWIWSASPGESHPEPTPGPLASTLANPKTAHQGLPRELDGGSRVMNTIHVSQAPKTVGLVAMVGS